MYDNFLYCKRCGDVVNVEQFKICDDLAVVIACLDCHNVISLEFVDDEE